jgi:hypothetical protein
MTRQRWFLDLHLQFYVILKHTAQRIDRARQSVSGRFSPVCTSIGKGKTPLKTRTCRMNSASSSALDGNPIDSSLCARDDKSSASLEPLLKHCIHRTSNGRLRELADYVRSQLDSKALPVIVSAFHYTYVSGGCFNSGVRCDP